jgi:hypothetical protein
MKEHYKHLVPSEEEILVLHVLDHPSYGGDPDGAL